MIIFELSRFLLEAYMHEADIYRLLGVEGRSLIGSRMRNSNSIIV